MKFRLIEILIVVAIIATVAGAIIQSLGKPKVVVIDGCEYLLTINANGTKSYTHKGNCTNEIHWRRLEK